MRNRINPVITQYHVSGINVMVMRKPAISSQTIPEWSCTPRSLEVLPHIQIPLMQTSAVTIRYVANELESISSKYTGIAAMVPNVPGALGARPLPKPKARKCMGLVHTWGLFIVLSDWVVLGEV